MAQEPIRISETASYARWLAGLRDPRVQAAVLNRIDRLRFGNPGDFASVGQGVLELRLHLGAGWRVYYIFRGNELVVLLGGGSKRRQARDIQTAQRIAAELEEERYG